LEEAALIAEEQEFLGVATATGEYLDKEN